MTAPANDTLAADLVTIIGALTAADVALLRAMADAERQADGRAAYPQPAGWAGRTR